MTKVKVGKEDPSSAEFVERRRAALERLSYTLLFLGFFSCVFSVFIFPTVITVMEVSASVK